MNTGGDEATAGMIAELRAETARLTREKEELERLLAERSASALAKINQELVEKLAAVEERVTKVERENRDFASMCVEMQEQNTAITNLYVASQRLHATLAPSEVMNIIKEILVELVGAEEFGILLLEEEKKRLQLFAGEGVEERFPSESLPMGEGVVGEVTASGRPFFFEPKARSDLEVGLPLAAIPLNIKGRTVGVIVLYKLLSQKAGFTPTDMQILELLATDAATALVSARLNSTMGRRLKTIEGFLQLVKPN